MRIGRPDHFALEVAVLDRPETIHTEAPGMEPVACRGCR